MDLLWFLLVQFQIPIIGLTLFGLFIWIRVFLRPIRRVAPPDFQKNEKAK